jgi:hypothetical protein
MLSVLNLNEIKILDFQAKTGNKFINLITGNFINLLPALWPNVKSSHINCAQSCY